MDKRLKKGDRFYSNFFNSWGKVYEYINDETWYFTLDIDNHERVYKSQVTPDKLMFVKGVSAMKKIFFDMEFTGLRQNTSLISIGLVSEDGHKFYAELTDYNRDQVDDWVRENVIKNLVLQNQESVSTDYAKDTKTAYVKGPKKYMASILKFWLQKEIGEQVEMWGDCLSYDWVLFCELFGGALKIPKNVYYIPFDLSTLFKIKGIDPDINREDFIGIPKDDKHNALHDAIIIKACYNKLMRGER